MSRAILYTASSTPVFHNPLAPSVSATLGFADFDLHLGSAADKDRTSEAIIYDYREAELRHGRLAMLAAAAWPLQELLSPALSRTFHVPALLAATAGRSPSVLNGGLDQAGIPVLLALTAVAISSLDLYALQVKEEKGDAWLPGDLGFDPLRLLKGASPAAVRDMQAKEVNNGRLAMLAVLGYVVEEAVTGKPIVYLTSGLFQPLYENDGVRHAMDAAFSASTF